MTTKIIKTASKGSVKANTASASDGTATEKENNMSTKKTTKKTVRVPATEVTTDLNPAAAIEKAATTAPVTKAEVVTAPAADAPKRGRKPLTPERKAELDALKTKAITEIMETLKKENEAKVAAMKTKDGEEFDESTKQVILAQLNGGVEAKARGIYRENRKHRKDGQPRMDPTAKATKKLVKAITLARDVLTKAGIQDTLNAVVKAAYLAVNPPKA